MNTKILSAFLLMASLSGCLVVSDGSGGGDTHSPPAQPGNVMFTWSFAGATCSDLPGIKSVQVQIPGETLQNAGVYPCSANGYPGIELHDFAPGSYSFNLTALGWDNEALYAGSGTFIVNGDVRVTVDLTPVGGPNSYAYLTWRFPPNSASSNPTCEQAGVAYVYVSIDGGAWESFNCADGFALPGVVTPYLEAGVHNISIVAANASDYDYYRYDGKLQTFAGDPISAEYHLNWAVGGAAISWNLTNGSVAQSCAQAGVSYVYINFQDAQGNMVYSDPGDRQPCTSAPVLYQYLQPGTYRVYIQAAGSYGSSYLSNAQYPPMVTVVAGRFVDGSTSTNVQLFRQ